MDTQDSADKKLTSHPAARSVSNLSPSQLTRKRTHDRNAKRATRQRNKEYIENLQTQIEALSKSTLEENRSALAQIKLRNQELEEEVAALKKLIAASHLAELPEPDLGAAILEPGPAYNANVDPTRDIFTSSIYPPEVESVKLLSQTALKDSKPPDLCVANLDKPYQTQTMFAGPLTVKGTKPQSLMNSTRAIPTSFINQPTTLFWELPLLTLPPNDPVSVELISILQQERFSDLTMPDKRSSKLSFRYLFFPDSKPDDIISFALINLATSAGVTRIPEVIASIWGIYKVIRWQIRPCLENYNEIPLHLIPRPSQFTVPHQQWVSGLQLPNIRDIVLERQDVYANMTFLSLFTQSIRVNWPYRDIDTVKLEADGSLAISDKFEEHVLNSDNWSMTAPFTYAYPELQWTCKYTS